jgi:hypothetical protein
MFLLGVDVNVGNLYNINIEDLQFQSQPQLQSQYHEPPFSPNSIPNSPLQSLNFNNTPAMTPNIPLISGKQPYNAFITPST